MGVKKRKKSRNKSQYRIASKRRAKKMKKDTNPDIVCESMKSAWDKKKPAATNLSNMGLVFDLGRIAPTKTQVTQTASTSTNPETKKKRKRKKMKTTEVVHQLEEQLIKEEKAKKAVGIRLTCSQLEYAQTMVTMYGEDYKAMARDPRNYFQDTWKQIQAKIKLFTQNPRYYIPFLKSRGLLKQGNRGLTSS